MTLTLWQQLTDAERADVILGRVTQQAAEATARDDRARFPLYRNSGWH